MAHIDSFVPLIASSCAVPVLIAEMRRRRLAGLRLWRTPPLTILDAISPPFALGIAIATLLALASSLASAALASLGESIVWLAIFYYLWREGRRTIQFQRPNGIAFSQFLVLAGAVHLFFVFLRGTPRITLHPPVSLPIAAVVSIVSGIALLLWIVPRFLKRAEEHCIIEQVAPGADLIQAEYHPATRECSHPERWRMFDPMTAEIEVLDFLENLVTTLKPHLIVETGAFTALSTLRMAAGMQQNGFGKIVSCEIDPVIFGRAKQRIEDSGLGRWIELRNESSLNMKIEGIIDIFFSDSGIPLREQEVRRFLPQVNPFGLVLIHDASSHTKIVRQAALRLEEEGLLSVVLFPTPRGLVVAQKREGRK